MSSESRKDGFCLVFTLSMPWKNYHREQFIRSIASSIEKEGGIVICVEPTVLSFFNILNYPERILDWVRGKYRLRKSGTNIFVTHAKTFEHVLLSSRSKVLAFLNRKMLKRQLWKIIKKASPGIEDMVMVLHRPELHFLIGYLGEAGSIYDCCDDHSLTSNMNSLKVAGNLERERILAEKSSFIIATCSKLYRRNAKYNPNTYIIENGFDFDGAIRDKEIDTYLKGIKKPIIGYIGIIRGWIDYELLEFLLSEYPDYSFVFVGEVYKDSVKTFEVLSGKYRNLFLPGRVPYKSLPSAMEYFDVGVIPFRMNEFMESVNPNKFYEMISCGVAVVSTNIGDLKEKYSSICAIADTKEEFGKKISEYLLMGSDRRKELSVKAKEAAKEHTWIRKAEYFHLLLRNNILN